MVLLYLLLLFWPTVTTSLKVPGQLFLCICLEWNFSNLVLTGDVSGLPLEEKYQAVLVLKRLVVVWTIHCRPDLSWTNSLPEDSSDQAHRLKIAAED